MPISIMIKPASSNCNLRCKYCFYHDLADNRSIPSHGIMSIDTLSDVLKKAFAYAKGSAVSICFQGGEPLLAGKEFFRAFAKLLSALNTDRCPVFVGVQTNGTLIDDEWCDIFKSNRYLVGLSLDGTRETNAFRIDADGNPTFDKVLLSAKLLQKHGVDFNILTVLTKPVAQNVKAVYDFYKANGFKYLQFIPCLKPLDSNDKEPCVTKNQIKDCQNNTICGEDENLYLDSKDYEYFLKTAFDLYAQDFASGRYLSIRAFDNMVRLAHGERPEQCGMDGHCTHQYVIESDGEVYPCDFYCIDRYSLGNLKDTDFFQLERHPKAIEFIRESIVVEEKCRSCPYYRLCKNGCKRERIDVDKCEAYKRFFPKAIPHLLRMS